MSKSMKVRLLIVFLVVAITLTPLAILYPRVTALTEIAYEDEKGIAAANASKINKLILCSFIEPPEKQFVIVYN